MITDYQQPTPDPLTPQQVRLLQLIEAVMAEYHAWRKVRMRMQTQLVNDFPHLNLDPDQVCNGLDDFQIFALALQHIGGWIQTEADEVVDLFHTWLTD